MPQKVWAVGEEALAADWNAYLQQQVVPQFTTPAQRDAQWTAPPKGGVCVTQDTLTVWIHDGVGWARMPGTVIASTTCTANSANASNSTRVLVTGSATPSIAFATPRTVKVDVFASIQVSTPGNMRIESWMDGANWGPNLQPYLAAAGGAGESHLSIVGTAAVPAGSHVFDLRLLSINAGTATVLTGSRLLLTEIGA